MATKRVSSKAFKSFDEFSRSLIKSGEYNTLLVYPHLRFGMFWHIADGISGFGSDKWHPFVLVETYPTGLPTIRAYPRTTEPHQGPEKQGVRWKMPKGIVPSLDKEGTVLCCRWRRILIKHFGDTANCERIGMLPDEWLERLRVEVNEQRRLEGSLVAAESEE